MTKFIKLDADNIGDRIELALLNGDVKGAQEIHKAVQKAIQNIKETINTFPNWSILMIGCDDILMEVLVEDKKIIENLELLRKRFISSCGFTLSIGVGGSLQEALINLTKAKLKGKDVIVGPS